MLIFDTIEVWLYAKYIIIARRSSMTRKNLNMRYLLALEKAAIYLQEGLEVPESLIEEALEMKKPTPPNTLGSEERSQYMDALNRYRMEAATFLNAATRLAESK